MASGNFDACLAITLKWEGGYSNHPDDPGGPTMRGVIQREYDAYRKRKGLSRRPVARLEEAELREIYREGYWGPMGCDALPAGLDLCVFDAAVNSGPGRAKQWLEGGPSIETFCARRMSFLQGLGRLWRVFGTGWKRRVFGIRAAALTMEGGGDAPAEAVSSQLHAGMKSLAVTALQKRLRSLGYPCGLVDGVFGQQTFRAVVLFQTDHELPGEAGVWDASYNEVLEKASAMLPGRKAATAKDVAATGDKPIHRMNLLQRVFAWLFGASAAAQVFEGGDVLSALGAAKTAFEPAMGLASWVAENRWMLVAVGCIGVIALMRAIRADHVEAFQNFDYQGQPPKGEMS